MSKSLLLLVFFIFSIIAAKAQDKIIVKGDSLKKVPDTAKYVNLGKIAAKKAVYRSMIIPGWGQVGNGLNVYRGLKVGAIYAGGTMLVLSYFDNTRMYKAYLHELQYRLENNGISEPGSPYAKAQTSALTTAKDTYRRNREVVIFSLVGVYAINVIDAYVDARLKYFDVGDNLAIKVSPSMINSNTMYGYNSFTPALKIAFRL
jgi:hypothetical protein